MSLTKRADSAPVDEDDRDEQHGGVVDAGDGAPRQDAEEPRQAQARHQHHHPEQQDDRPVVDRVPRLVERKPADDHHEDGADERSPGSVDAEERRLPDRQHEVGAREDRDDGGNVEVEWRHLGSRQEGEPGRRGQAPPHDCSPNT